jgi:hypothetical protein
MQSNPGIYGIQTPSPGKLSDRRSGAMPSRQPVPGQQRGAQQFTKQRARKQSGEAVYGSGERQVELRHKSVEYGADYLLARAFLVTGDVLGGCNRAHQFGSLLDALIRAMKAAPALKQVARVSAFDGSRVRN